MKLTRFAWRLPIARTSGWKAPTLILLRLKISPRNKPRCRSSFSAIASTGCARWEFPRGSCTWPTAERFARGRAPGEPWVAPAQKKQEVMCARPLEPCLAWRARIISLREIPAGQAVGYGARFITSRPSRIAVINAGYADGIVRARTNRGWALVRGHRVPLVGTISMDLTMLDVTDAPGAKLGDVVTLYGKDGQASIEVSEVAREIGTVTSDLLCALGRRVPKFYL